MNFVYLPYHENKITILQFLQFYIFTVLPLVVFVFMQCKLKNAGKNVTDIRHNTVVWLQMSSFVPTTSVRTTGDRY